MATIRQPAVAGTFYPADAQQLRAMIEDYLHAVKACGPVPKALIVPHAGYVYSGPVAASGYVHVEAARERIRRVVLLGPAHWVPLHGLAASSAEAFLTPLGTVPVDQEAMQHILTLPQVRVNDAAHAPEHSLEVQLPFLQAVLDVFCLVPLVVGETAAEEVAEVLERLWDGPETLIVVSSDLSHYHDYATARRIDAATSRVIEALRSEDLSPEQACGYYPLCGLLYVARQQGLQVTTVDLRNSGDTAGPRHQVVGYGAYVLA